MLKIKVSDCTDKTMWVEFESSKSEYSWFDPLSNTEVSTNRCEYTINKVDMYEEIKMIMDYEKVEKAVIIYG